MQLVGNEMVPAPAFNIPSRALSLLLFSSRLMSGGSISKELKLMELLRFTCICADLDRAFTTYKMIGCFKK